MHWSKWIVPAFVGLGLAGIALYVATIRHPAVSACAKLYADITPEDARITDVEERGRKLVVHYASATGSGTFPCFTRADGSLDDVTTLDQKATFYWEHPEVVPRAGSAEGWR